MGPTLNWALIVLSLYPTSGILGLSRLPPIAAAFQSNFLRYPGRTSHSKHKPLHHAATNILLPQQMNGLSEANPHKFATTKTYCF